MNAMPARRIRKVVPSPPPPPPAEPNWKSDHYARIPIRSITGFQAPPMTTSIAHRLPAPDASAVRFLGLPSLVGKRVDWRFAQQETLAVDVRMDRDDNVDVNPTISAPTVNSDAMIEPRELENNSESGDLRCPPSLAKQIRQRVVPSPRVEDVGTVSDVNSDVMLETREVKSSPGDEQCATESSQDSAKFIDPAAAYPTPPPTVSPSGSVSWGL